MSPDYLDAKLVVGAHNYVLGSLPWGVKIAASLVGLSGSKDKGIQYLQEVSKGKGEGGDDARAVLILFLRREHRYSEALEMARGLLSKYPHNSLLAIEEANLLRANGDLSGAASAYRRVMEQGHDGRYPGQHYEMAALNLGEQLRYEKDFLGAINAYAQVGEVKNADPDLKQKAGLYAGETYDLMHKRDDALKKYQEVIAVNSSNARAELARERMKEPYRP
jgi:tetratricopeptide (TPR) repeat protein